MLPLLPFSQYIIEWIHQRAQRWNSKLIAKIPVQPAPEARVILEIFQRDAIYVVHDAHASHLSAAAGGAARITLRHVAVT